MTHNLDNVKLYYINLDRSPERREAAERQAEQHELPLERVAAVDGRTLTPADLTRYDSKRRKKEFINDLSPGEHACTLSHIKALQLFVESGAEFGVILEDDFVLHPQFKNGIAWLTKKTSGWQILKLYTAAGKLYPLNYESQDSSSWKLVFPKQLPWVSVGIMYTREGAITMLKCLERYWLSFDAQWGWYLLTRNIPVAGISPGLINTSDNDNANSTIDDGGSRYAAIPQQQQGKAVKSAPKRTLGQYLLHRFCIWRVAAGKLNMRITMPHKLRVSK